MPRALSQQAVVSAVDIAQEVFAADAQHYHEQGWSSIAPLYGLDHRGRPERCQLLQVYALIKLTQRLQDEQSVIQRQLRDAGALGNLTAA
eukprot:SAG22_NODE_1154_length_5343_cov_15.970633_3_plen_90_part_00